MKTRKRRVAKKRGPWELRLYIVNTTAKSILATGNLQSLCEQYLHGQCRITIIDIFREPGLARLVQILATPTLVRVHPGPQKTLIGTLSDAKRVLEALELGPQPEELRALLSRAGVHIGNA